MPRGRRNVEKTRRILQKILNKILYKQIAYEENTNIRSIAWIKGKYVTERVTLVLNDKGIRLMGEEQLRLPLFPNKPILRNPERRKNYNPHHWKRVKKRNQWL